MGQTWERKKIISDIVQSALNNIPSINEDIEIKYEQICIMQISFEIIRRDRSFNTSGQKKWHFVAHFIFIALAHSASASCNLIFSSVGISVDGKKTPTFELH